MEENKWNEFKDTEVIDGEIISFIYNKDSNKKINIIHCLRFILEKIDYNDQIKHPEVYSRIKYLSEKTNKSILKLLYSSISYYFSYKIFQEVIKDKLKDINPFDDEYKRIRDLMIISKNKSVDEWNKFINKY